MSQNGGQDGVIEDLPVFICNTIATSLTFFFTMPCGRSWIYDNTLYLILMGNNMILSVVQCCPTLYGFLQAWIR